MDLYEFLEKKGACAYLAEKIDVSYNWMWQIKNGYKQLPLKHCAEVEIATNGQVTRKELRPYDWHKIWPELREDFDKRSLSEISHQRHINKLIPEAIAKEKNKINKKAKELGIC